MSDALSTLDQLDRQLKLLDSLEEIGDALDEYGERLADYTTANVEGKFSEDASVDWLLGHLKDALTSIEAIGEPYDTLTGPAGTVGDIAGHYNTVQDMLSGIARAESLSGTEKADVLKSIVEGMPGLASALTGLGGFNPVIGIFITLYGKAIESAGIVIGMISVRHDEQMAIISSRGELDVEALLAERNAAAEQARRARQGLQDEYDRVFAAWLDEKHAKGKADRRVATRYCVQQNRDTIRRALAEASRFQPSGANSALSETTSVDETDLNDVDAWVKGIAGDISEAMVAAAEGDPTGALTERARRLSDAKYEVQQLLKPVKDCIRERLNWMATRGEGSGRRRRLVMAGGGGIFGVGLLVSAFVLLPGDDQPATTPSGADRVASTTVVVNESTSDDSTQGSTQEELNDPDREAAPSAVPEPLALVHPCDVVSATDYSELVGHPAEAGRSGNDRRLICVMSPPDGLGSPNMGMWLEVQRGDTGFFENWQGRHAEAAVVQLSSPIADLSEARVNEFSIGCTTEVRSGPAVTLQAHLTGDPLGRDVFVLVEAQPVLTCDGPDVPEQAFQLGVVENLAQQLVDALLAQSG